MNRKYFDLNAQNLFLKIDIEFEHTIFTQGMKTVQGSIICDYFVMPENKKSSNSFEEVYIYTIFRFYQKELCAQNFIIIIKVNSNKNN